MQKNDNVSELQSEAKLENSNQIIFLIKNNNVYIFFLDQKIKYVKFQNTPKQIKTNLKELKTKNILTKKSTISIIVYESGWQKIDRPKVDNEDIANVIRHIALKAFAQDSNLLLYDFGLTPTAEDEKSTKLIYLHNSLEKIQFLLDELNNQNFKITKIIPQEEAIVDFISNNLNKKSYVVILSEENTLIIFTVFNKKISLQSSFKNISQNQKNPQIAFEILHIIDSFNKTHIINDEKPCVFIKKNENTEEIIHKIKEISNTEISYLPDKDFIECIGLFSNKKDKQSMFNLIKHYTPNNIKLTLSRATKSILTIASILFIILFYNILALTKNYTSLKDKEQELFALEDKINEETGGMHVNIKNFKEKISNDIPEIFHVLALKKFEDLKITNIYIKMKDTKKSSPPITAIKGQAYTSKDVYQLIKYIKNHTALAKLDFTHLDIKQKKKDNDFFSEEPDEEKAEKESVEPVVTFAIETEKPKKKQGGENDLPT